jgi:hypothetical protein
MVSRLAGVVRRHPLRFGIPFVALWTLVLILAINVLSGPSDPSSPYFTKSKILAGHSQNHDVPLLAVNSGPAGARVPQGPVSRPDPKLTPGAVAIKDSAAVCKVSKHEPRISPTNPLIPLSEQQAVFQSYRISPVSSRHYALDFLVPLQLGGALTQNNVWPISTTKGTGFTQKELLNVRMHILVCHGEMPLAEAQRMMAEDWVGLWVRYGA